MSRITTLDDFRIYLKKTLGNPVVNVEVADEQYDQLIEDAVQDFQRYTYGEATFRDAITLTLTSGVSAYQLSGDIDSILDISLSFINTGINDLFSPQHTLLYNDWVNGNYPGGSGGSTGPAGLGGAMVMSNYDTSMIYLKEIDDHFTRRYTCDFNPNSYIMRVWPTPEENCKAMLTVYKKETAENLYNNPLLKKLARARVKMLWGEMLDKYAMTLPGGGNINGDKIYQRGKDEETEAILNIKGESEPPLFMVG